MTAGKVRLMTDGEVRLMTDGEVRLMTGRSVLRPLRTGGTAGRTGHQYRKLPSFILAPALGFQRYG